MAISGGSRFLKKEVPISDYEAQATYISCKQACKSAQLNGNNREKSFKWVFPRKKLNNNDWSSTG